MATRLLRDKGAGCTLLISPLLALMRNQIAAVESIGVKAVTINSSNTDDWEVVQTQLLADEVDILLIKAASTLLINTYIIRASLTQTTS